MSGLCLKYVTLYLHRDDIFAFMPIESAIGKISSRTGRVGADKIVTEQLRGHEGVPGRRDFNRGRRELPNRPVIGSSLPESVKAQALRLAAAFGLS